MSDHEVVELEPYTVRPSMAVCSECGSKLTLIIWGEGIDSSIECEGCGAKDIYR